MFEKNLIAMPEQEFADKQEVISYLTHITNDKVTDADLYEKDVRERENVIPTYVGYGIGLPHARTAGVKEAFVVYARLKNEVPWGEQDEEKANQVFLIGVPEKNDNNDSGNLHLKILAMLSRKLVHEEFRNKLANAKDAEEVYAVLKEIEEDK